jgi:predicted HD phosphohydrolase
MGASSKMAREKLSTTVSPETHEFLMNMVKNGEVATLAEAIDALVARVRRLENRRRLAAATAAYFDQLSPAAAHEEQELAAGLSSATSKIDFDREI